MVPFASADWLFWTACAVVCYAYVGYWLWLRLFARAKPVKSSDSALKSSAPPSVSIVMAARNEAHHLSAKLANLRRLQYAPDRVQIIVVSDGSTDETAKTLQQHPEVTAVLLQRSGGKALALNAGVAQATGELLFMMDVRQTVDPDALQRLVPLFADPTVGAASGELLLEQADGSPSTEGLGLYWKIEKAVRRLESLSGSVVGVTGAIYVLRRDLYQALPAGLVLDDVLVPMLVARRGFRVLFQPAAVARDRIFAEPGKEFRRKVRTLTGNLQLLKLAPWLLGPGNPLLFRMISHKLLRLLVPFLLAVMLVASAVSHSTVLRLALVAQLLLYALALLGAVAPRLRTSRAVGVAYTFVMLNAAAAVAFYKFLTRQDVWQ